MQFVENKNQFDLYEKKNGNFAATDFRFLL